jgi:DnaJ family protein C protein 28
MAEQADGPKKVDSVPKSAGGYSKSRRRRGLQEWQDLITEQLDEAAANGAFDNLPGKGEPLRLHEHPNEPADMRMANKLLKDNDLTPAWIGDRKALLAEIEALRAAMQQQWDQICARIESDGNDREAPALSWNRTLIQWEERIADLNRRIVDLNITLPVWRMELHRLRLDEELNRIGATGPAEDGH